MLGWNVDLDKRAATNIRGASRTAPHSLIQELLNRTDQHLWAILTNGKRLRLLRDNIVMGRPAYIEFDLEGMFIGEQFADFAILYALAHATRLRSEEPADCILEQWRTTAINDGTRALEHLRDGVVEALKTLGTGFLEHPDNADLRDLLKGNHGATDDYYRWLLRIVYRLIFLFVAEDRDLLHSEDTPTNTRQRYADYFSTQHLRVLATRKRAGRHADAWAALRLVFDALGNDGEPALGLPAYGSDLFTPGFIGTLNHAKISNDRFLDAIRSLSQLPDRATGTVRPVDYKNLGSEELGSVYEALLEYVPTLADDGRTFALSVLGGNARKTSGSYYTPSELVELLLDETLDPVLDAAASSDHPVEALLAVTVCDPACGSGHFLVAAARRIARRLATARTGDPEPTPDAMREALREVIARCLYGVDLSDLAAELAKVSLWLESLTPGQPLAFLDAHIKVGNGLLGTNPRRLADGVPDAAFGPLLGDDDPCDACHRIGITNRVTAAQAKAGRPGCSHPKWSAIVKKNNRQQREAAARRTAQDGLFDVAHVLVSNTAIAQSAASVEAAAASTDVATIRAAADAWRRAQVNPDLVRAKEVSDAWCAAFAWPLTRQHARSAPTYDMVRDLAERDDLSPLAATRNLVSELSRKHRFFHWHLEFPHIFTVDPDADTPTGWTGGFTCMIGNPPWGMIEIADKEWFDAHGRADIANASTAARRAAMIAELADEDRPLHDSYLHDKRASAEVGHLLSESGCFPLTGTGRIDTFQVFAEGFNRLVDERGRAGIIVPTTLATGSTLAPFFKSLVDAKRLAAFYDFENKYGLFPAVDSRFRFAAMTTTGPHEPIDATRYAFIVHRIPDIPALRYTLTPGEVALINPNTGNAPVFANRVDADLALHMHRTHPVLVNEDGAHENGNPWGLWFQQGHFNMSSDSGSFRSASDLEALGATFDGFNYASGARRWLPLYEGKHFWHHDHRYGTYAGLTGGNTSLPDMTDAQHDDPTNEVLALHWVDEREVTAKQTTSRRTWTQEWHLAWRDITNATNERTLVTALIPGVAVGNNAPLARPIVAANAALLIAALASLPTDWLVRQKVSNTHLNFYILKQVAVPTPQTFAMPTFWSGDTSLADWVKPRVLELAYTSNSMEPFAIDIGDTGRPFRWIPERRAQIRAELDAAMMHVYGLSRTQAEQVLAAFPGLARNEVNSHGEYRTKRFVLDAYDRMTKAADARQEFVSFLSPPPGQGPRHP